MCLDTERSTSFLECSLAVTVGAQALAVANTAERADSSGELPKYLPVFDRNELDDFCNRERMQTACGFTCGALSQNDESFAGSAGVVGGLRRPVPDAAVESYFDTGGTELVDFFGSQEVHFWNLPN